jgi:dipeptidyl aminopeptidase/acylaminoacyl peptidase
MHPADGEHIRLSFRFSARADHAACLVADGHSELSVEGWAFDGGRARHRRLRTAAGETVRTQPLPTEDGRVVLVRNGRGRHEVAVAHAEHETGLGTLECQALRAVPSRDPDTLAWLFAVYPTGDSRIYRVDAAEQRLEPVLRVPGRLVGEGALNDDGGLLAANQVLPTRRRIVALDLRAGTVEPVGPPGHGLLLTNPARAELLVAAPTPDGITVGWAAAGGEVRPSSALPGIAGAVLPLAVDPAGERLAVRVTDGARSRLYIVDIDADARREVLLPPGVIKAAGWSRAGLRLLRSCPARPAEVVTVDPARPHAAPSAAPAARHRHRAAIESFDGPAGPIEAIVYGDWRRSPRLLVALHGGPEAAWELDFDPAFQRIAAAGVAIVAPNQRGSTGYGAAHRDAIRGAWGGPDLADVRCLLATLTRHRRHPRCVPPMLYGVSYGAFLALVAAAVDPDAWSRCVAIAPFLAGSRLHADASPAVRSWLERTGGDTDLDDEWGRRDLLALAPRIRAPLLLIHGERDDVIPVGHSRRLAAALAGVTYREIAGGGHNPVGGPGGRALLDDLVGFLLAESPASVPVGAR